MTITDAERHRLHTRLDQVLGEEDAAVLISHLPPSGWSDVARTRDLDQLEARMNSRFAIVDERFNTMEARFDATLERVLREQTHRFLAFSCAIATIAVAVLSAVIGLVAG
jgi:hypothetical protein